MLKSPNSQYYYHFNQAINNNDVSYNFPASVQTSQGSFLLKMTTNYSSSLVIVAANSGQQQHDSLFTGLLSFLQPQADSSQLLTFIRQPCKLASSRSARAARDPMEVQSIFFFEF